MLKLQRIMEIAEDHARHCCSSGSPNGEHHNIQVLSVAIQEALSENDENTKRRDATPKSLRTKILPTHAEPGGAYRGS
jgi:hypothetical protein